MDVFQQVVSSSAWPVMIAGNVDATQVVLLDFEEDLAGDAPLTRDLTGLMFLGCAGLGQDGPLVAWAVPLTTEAEIRLAEAYARHCKALAEKVFATQAAQSTEWLSRLHALEDPRPN